MEEIKPDVLEKAQFENGEKSELTALFEIFGRSGTYHLDQSILFFNQIFLQKFEFFDWNFDGRNLNLLLLRVRVRISRFNNTDADLR